MTYLLFYTKQHGISDANCYYYLQKCKDGQPDWGGNNSSISPRELFEKAILNVEEVLNYIHVRFLYAHEHLGNSVTLMPDDLKPPVIKYQVHRKYGRCFAYHPEMSFREAGIYYLKINV